MKTSDLKERLAKLPRQKLELLAEELLVRQNRSGPERQPIAIVGMGCRLPGGIRNPRDYWRLLREGKDAIGEIPPDRWPVDHYYDASRDTPGKIYTRHGAFLEDIDRFDYRFFHLAAEEARAMDPQHRLFLEVTWEALENAGVPPDRLTGTASGVFVGISSADYAYLYLKQSDPSLIDAHFGTGTGHSVCAGRIAYLLGLEGPSLAVDTACSSSLVAVHLACRSLADGECDLALAGGVQLILSPEMYLFLCRAGALAPDGRCKAFDAAADGYVRGEGCGVLVLKRLSDAVADGDPMLAVIRGSAFNQDGRSNGLHAPNGRSQEAVVQAALENAGLEAARVGYVEAHGSGTLVGDSIELTALGNRLALDRAAESPCAVGSVKTNLGHLEAASGVAGLIKIALMLRHRQIPPTLHFKTPNPHVSWQRYGFEIPTQLRDWATPGQPLVAGINAFSWAGANVHMFLEQPPAPAPGRPSPAARPWCFLPLSARSEGALQALAEDYRGWLEAHPDTELSAVCATAGGCRTHHDHRLAVLACSSREVAARLAAFVADQAAEGLVRGGQIRRRRRLKLGFLFSRTAPPGTAMRQLLSEATLAEAVAQCGPAAEAAATVGSVWQRGLALLFQSWTSRPDAVAGIGCGEATAAHLAGALSLEDCWRAARLAAGEEAPADSPIGAEAVRLPFYSASAGRFCEGPELGREHWQAAEDHDPEAAVRALAGRGIRLIVHFGAAAAVEPRDLPPGTKLISCLDFASPLEGLLTALGLYYAAGGTVRWRGLYPTPGLPLRLPTYPWQRQRVWLETHR